jgi:replicative DNA helicase
MINDLPPLDENRSTTVQMAPYNQQAEEAVLGAVLINPDAYFEISQIIESDHFYLVRNRWIWDVLAYLHDQRIPIDLVTTTEELERRNQLTDIGGQAYLISLINQTPSSLNAEAYARIVEETSVRRRMINAAKELANLAFDQQKPINTILDSAEKAVFNLSEKRVSRDMEHVRDVISAYYEQVSAISLQGEELFGVRTGLTDIDKLLSGMQKSDLLIIAGRPGAGKSGFLLTTARNVAQKYKKNVAFFSMEMSNEQLVQRLIAQETGINTQRLRSCKLGEDEWDQFVRAVEILSGITLFLDDTPAITPLQMRTKCRRLYLEHGLDLILVDYIQLMASDARTENRVQEVSYISRSLKALAKELKVPVLAAAQLSRAAEKREDKEFKLSDLRESGSLEQDADVVMFIQRETEKPNIAKIIVAKHRNGPTKDDGIEVFFKSDTVHFENAATIYQDDTISTSQKKKK